MTNPDHPSIDEVALGAFFEDIGKFMQRARGSVQTMPAAVRARDSDVLPTDGRGGYSHKHALWTDAFFDWMENQGLTFPEGITRDRVRDAAVYHHNPRTPLQRLSAVADHLSAGMDRAAKDETAGQGHEDKAWDRFRRIPLQNIFQDLDLALGKAEATAYTVADFTPSAMFPGPVDREGLPRAYEALWASFCDGFAALCQAAITINQFHDGLLALSERYTWAIPSSTVDQPDVSLHDHNRTVAAFAACLYRHHAARDELDDEASIRDPERAKFRVLVGDLSGIQSSLFRLKSEGVEGVNRILRARSFLMGQLGEAAALLCRQAFGLPPYCLLQSAGGRFQLLLPEVDGVAERVDDLRREIDQWMLQRYYGDLVLHLALSPPLAGQDFHQAGFAETQQRIAACVDAAKQRPLASVLAVPGAETERSILRVAFPAEGACPTCGVRPVPADAVPAQPDDPKRCPACTDDARLGQKIPKAVAVTWEPRGSGAALPGGLDPVIHDERFDRNTDRGARRRVVAGWRLRGPKDAGAFPPADRFLANQVPLLGPEDGAHGRYGDLSEEAGTVKVGEAKLFEHLAADAREWLGPDQGFAGRAMLSVVKADVDRLGFVFAHGLLRRASVGRVAQISRMVDAFFTGYLDHLIRTEFPNTYTVYAGGDDLLLIAPWLDGIRLAARLREAFGRFVGHNPNLTLSAGIEFMAVHEPLNRAVVRAEARLDQAKQAGRDRVSLVGDRPILWTGVNNGSLQWVLDRAQWLSDRVRDSSLPPTFVHRMLGLDRDRRRAEDEDAPDIAAANWRSRWGYHLARLRERLDRDTAHELARDLDALMCGGLVAPAPEAGTSGKSRPRPDARIPLTIALYRNR
ncbi:MAG: type III-A CRISPR-associated protein Cas10/Csm1 [Rhodospirillales bacterium]|nr:MAG: type III-A CRISPR-associated protein Cas10/Csm1 [Rhodospirillales bacterium]